MLLSCRLLSLGLMTFAANSPIALAQTTPSQPGTTSSPEMREMMQDHHRLGMMPMTGHPGMPADANTPTMLGQDAFGAIQEIVRILDADPNTDWSKVDLEALRQHLIDMNEVTLRAEAVAEPIDGGLQIAVTGSDRTLTVIQHMVPAWAQAMNGHQGWSTKAAQLPDGELLTVTTADPKEVQHIRGLGFIGLLVSGSMHQPHHLAMAKGKFAHSH
jgi:hypothetical protein